MHVRRRGDALHTTGVDSSFDDAVCDPAFDAFADIVQATHGAGLEVHAWVSAMAV